MLFSCAATMTSGVVYHSPISRLNSFVPLVEICSCQPEIGNRHHCWKDNLFPQSQFWILPIARSGQAIKKSSSNKVFVVVIA